MAYQEQKAQDKLTSQPEAHEPYSATCPFKIFQTIKEDIFTAPFF